MSHCVTDEGGAQRGENGGRIIPYYRFCGQLQKRKEEDPN